MDGQDKLQAGSKVDPHAGGTSGNRNGQTVREWRFRFFPVSRARLFGQVRSAAFTHRSAMSPSRLFILRPVATTLLMVGLLLVGVVAYTQLPGVRASGS